MSDLSKYINSESVMLNRSDIHFADYNPRTISDEALKTLKRGIRKYGMVGGIVVNRQTDNTLVQGHQRLTVMDDLQHYNPETHENDYAVRCDMIDIDLKSEQELVILLNNPNAQGSWDYDRLRELVPNIDYKDAGLTAADLSMIGVDFTTMQDIGVQEAEVAITQALMPDYLPTAQPTTIVEQDDTTAEPTWEQRVQAMKDLKQQVKEKAQQTAATMQAYVMLSFDNQTNLQDFLTAFGLPEGTYMVKGEEFMTMLNDTMQDNEE